MDDKFMMQKCKEYEGRITYLERLILGNGGPGMKEDLREMRDAFISAKGFFKGIGWILCLLGFGQIANLALLFYK